MDTKADFKKLKELGALVERHHAPHTSSDEKAQSLQDLRNLTTLDFSSLTETLNGDIEEAQAAMLIRQIIREHPFLEKIFLKNNRFSEPDLQFIINALLMLKQDGAKSSLVEVHLTNSVSPQNLERSGADLHTLRKSYGDIIKLDDIVYQHFIDTFKAACEKYVMYLAQKVILPRTKQETSDNALELADNLTKKIPTSANAKLATAMRKYNSVRGLQKMLAANGQPREIFISVEKEYQKIKKTMPKATNKEEAAQEIKFHDVIGGVKIVNSIYAKGNPNSLFRPAAKVKRKKRKVAAKPKTKAKVLTAK